MSGLCCAAGGGSRRANAAASRHQHHDAHTHAHGRSSQRGGKAQRSKRRRQASSLSGYSSGSGSDSYSSSESGRSGSGSGSSSNASTSSGTSGSGSSTRASSHSTGERSGRGLRSRRLSAASESSAAASANSASSTAPGHPPPPEQPFPSVDQARSNRNIFIGLAVLCGALSITAVVLAATVGMLMPMWAPAAVFLMGTVTLAIKARGSQQKLNKARNYLAPKSDKQRAELKQARGDRTLHIVLASVTGALSLTAGVLALALGIPVLWAPFGILFMGALTLSLTARNRHQKVQHLQHSV